MITHYFKVATRNLLKYRSQSLISILGLAVGFACFALSAIWIRHEMTFDSFHEDAGQICMVRREDKDNANGLNSVNPYVLAGYLKEHFPEVKGACSTQGHRKESKYIMEEREVELHTLRLDSAAFSVFDIRILEGNADFLLPRKYGKPCKIAITRRGAQKLYGNESPIGKILYDPYRSDVPLTICAVVSEWDYHSNLAYDIVQRCYDNDSWGSYSWSTYIRLQNHVKVKDFAAKLYDHVIEMGRKEPGMGKFVLTPITSMRYDRPDVEGEVKFRHVVLFALAGALVILCCLLNYISLFINRIRMRGREFALRMVHGSSSFGLFKLLMSEYVLLLLAAWLVGMTIIDVAIRPFTELSEVTLDRFDIYGESAVYCLIMILLSSLFAVFPIIYYRRKSVQSVLSAQKNGRSKDLFRKGSILFQLIISIGFIFCASIIMKQLHYLNHADMGIKLKNIAKIYAPDIDEDWIADQVRQLPEVEEVLPHRYSLFPAGGGMFWHIRDWEEKKDDAEMVMLKIIPEDTTIVRFYGLTMLKGKMLDPSSDKHDMVLNEAAVKAFGWTVDDAVGKEILFRGGETRHIHIIGVMKDYCAESHTLPVKPIGFGNMSFDYTISGMHSTLLRFKEGTWSTCREKIENLIKKEYPDKIFNINNAEEDYQKFLTSENALLKMLTALSVVCIVLSMFGIYSQVVLTCEQRRKEIAIRKVNGAKLSDILAMFAREYIVLLLIGSVIAFAVGYAIMKQWIENYTRQTEMSLWVFAVIFLGVALVIALCIGWKVWRAASENPAEVVKSE